MSSPIVEPYANNLTFVSACRVLRDQVGGLLSCVSLGIDVKTISLKPIHTELSRALAYHDAHPGTLNDSDFTEAMFAFRKFYHVLAEKSGSDYVHPEPFYNAVFRICANVQRKRNNVPIIPSTPPAAPSSGAKRRRAPRTVKSASTVDSDSDVEVVLTTAGATPTVEVQASTTADEAIIQDNTVPSAMQVDESGDGSHVSAQSAIEVRPETQVVMARKRARVDLAFPKFPDARIWAMNVVTAIEGKRFPDKAEQVVSFRDFLIAQRSIDLLTAASNIEQAIVAARSLWYELEKLGQSSSSRA